MKNPDSRQAESGFVGEQLHLIDPLPFSPKKPPASTLTETALVLLLQGRALTTPDFQELTRSWRLAAYVGFLIHRYGWPIESEEVPYSDEPGRTIARYFMPEWVRQAAGASLEVAGFAQYEAAKWAWDQSHPDATPTERDAAMLSIARDCGV